MIREVKFRGLTDEGKWEKGQWVYGDLFHAGVNDIQIFPIDAEESFSVIPETVGQYTGLKDKNRIEIYDGDIIRNENHGRDGVVIYDDHQCYFGVSDDYPNTIYNCEMLNVPGDGYMQHEIEVIGNIHENEDLIK